MKSAVKETERERLGEGASLCAVGKDLPAEGCPRRGLRGKREKLQAQDSRALGWERSRKGQRGIREVSRPDPLLPGGREGLWSAVESLGVGLKQGSTGI